MLRARVLSILLTALVLPPIATAAGATPGDRRLTVFYTAEVHGTLEPCGCTSDPLGDVARYAEVVRTAAKSGAVLMVDAGGLSFPETSTPKEKEANGLRARFLTRALGTMGAPFVAGLAETDVAPADRDQRRSGRPHHHRALLPGDPGRNPGGGAWRRRSGARGPGGGEERGCDRRREARGRTVA